MIKLRTAYRPYHYSLQRYLSVSTISQRFFQYVVPSVEMNEAGVWVWVSYKTLLQAYELLAGLGNECWEVLYYTFLSFEILRAGESNNSPQH